MATYTYCTLGPLTPCTHEVCLEFNKRQAIKRYINPAIISEIKEEKMATFGDGPNPYNDVNTAASPTRESSIRDLRDDAMNQLQTLEANINDLFEVLGPLLRLDEPSDKKPSAPESSSAQCDIASSFENIYAGLISANDKLTRLRGRIDL